MNLEQYLARIKFEGPIKADLDCLNAIHYQHLLHIPYENIDVQLRRPLDFDIDRIFDKVVIQNRGGWCYEMNGLLCWALKECGFDVMRMVGAVGRKTDGEETLGNHLVLTVQLEQAYLVDVGLGDGLLTPIPLQAGKYTQGYRTFELEALGDNEWRFHNAPGTLPPDFDFTFGPANEDVLQDTCKHLQSDPGSMFRQNLIVQRLLPNGIHFLLGRVFFHRTAAGMEKTLLNSAAELSETLENKFGLKIPEIHKIWPNILARHEELFG
ncbi:MAG: arylamine N-acetyltransferase [Pseudomonadales bacterium]|jgi:N-hydroxyarylamine O-acetyltransferase